MKIFILLLIAILPLEAASISYRPLEHEFAFKDSGIAYISSSSALSLDYSVFSVGSVTDEAISWLLKPFSPTTFHSDGIMAGEEGNSLFLLFSPSFAAGWNLSLHGFSLSLAYLGSGDVSDTLFLDTPSRGGSEALHASALYEHEYFSIFSKVSLSEADGFDIMGRASASYGGITFAWSEGSSLSYGEDKSSIRRKMELSVKGGGVSYTAHIAFGVDPYISGSYRYHEGREKVAVNVFGVEIGALHTASFSTQGVYEQSSEYYFKWKSVTLGFDSEFQPIIKYDDGLFNSGIRGKSFYYGCTFISEQLEIRARVSSDGSISATLVLDL